MLHLSVNASVLQALCAEEKPNLKAEIEGIRSEKEIIRESKRKRR